MGLEIFGWVATTLATLAIVVCNRKAGERVAATRVRNGIIRTKNEMLRVLEQRALYIWSNMEKGGGFDFALEHSHIILGVKQLRDKYEELNALGDALPMLGELSKTILPDDMENLVKAGGAIPPGRLQATTGRIIELVMDLKSIPPPPPPAV